MWARRVRVCEAQRRGCGDNKGCSGALWGQCWGSNVVLVPIRVGERPLRAGWAQCDGEMSLEEANFISGANLCCRSVNHLPPGTKIVFADKIIQGLIAEGEEKCRLVIP